MEEDNLSFRIPIPQEPKGELISAQEAEKLLLAKLKKCEQELENAIWDLAILYSRTGRQDVAMQYINRLMASADDPERKALYFLKMGQFMEQIHNYEAAIAFYTQAFSLEPVNSETWYFINSNLGYCLNHFGRHKEAEPYCRAAIRIDPRKQNAYKNLGISLEGQGKYTEAAESYIKAVQANAGDPRALSHLEELVVNHGEMLSDIPDIQAQIEKCREAVDLARKIQRGFKDRLNRKANE
jgi:tetratricopeptide (TPR) repeat protein